MAGTEGLVVPDVRCCGFQCQDSGPGGTDLLAVYKRNEETRLAVGF